MAVMTWLGRKVFLAPGGWRQEYCLTPRVHRMAPTVKNEPAPEVSRLQLRSPELINAMRKARR